MTDMGGTFDLDKVEAEGPSGSVTVGGVNSSTRAIDLLCSKQVGSITVVGWAVLGSPRPQEVVVAWVGALAAGAGGTAANAFPLGL